MSKVKVTLPHLYSPRWYQKEIWEASDTYNRIFLVAHRRCLHPDTTITMHDGSFKYIKDIKPGDSILTYNHKTKQQEIKKVIDQYQTEKKQVFITKDKGMLPLLSTNDHRIFNPHTNAYVEAKDTTSVLLQKELLPEGTSLFSENLFRFLGYMCSDGSVTPKQTPKFTNNSKEMLEHVHDIVKELFNINSKWYPKNNGYDLIFSDSNGNYHDNAIKDFYKEHCPEFITIKNNRRVPKILWNTSKKNVYAFFSGIIDGDGSLFMQDMHKGYKNNSQIDVKIHVGLSKELALDYYYLLSKIGIIPMGIYKDKGCYFLRFSEKRYLVELLRNITLKNKEKEIKRHQFINLPTPTNTSINIRSITHTKTDVYENMYDLEVEDNHNFFANNILVHNSGKDYTCFNILVTKCMQEVCIGWYILPTREQARKVIWDAITNDGIKFLDCIPKELISRIDSTTKVIYLINGSTIWLLGADADSLVGANPKHIVFSEYALYSSDPWPLLQPIITANGGSVIFNTTPRGTNHAYVTYNMALNNPKWKVINHSVEHTKLFTAEQLEEILKDTTRDLFDQEYLCFPPGHTVITREGVKNIEDITAGDYVITHTNRFRRVIGTSRRFVENEPVDSIKYYGSRETVTATKKHKVLTSDTGRISEWKEIQDISTSDRVCFPKMAIVTNKLITEELATVIGWYIGEGSGRRGQAVFALNVTDDYGELYRSIQAVTNKPPTVTVNVYENTRMLSINSTQMVDFLSEHCGYLAANKKIPLSMISGNESAVFKALMLSDGCKTQKGWSYRTVSKTLAYQVQLLAHTLGYTAAICNFTGGERYVFGRICTTQDSYQIQISDKQSNYRKKIRTHKYNVTSTISSKSTTLYTGYVYNMEVDIDNSYTVNGIIVHNCKFLDGSSQVFKNIERIIQKDNTYNKNFPTSKKLYEIIPYEKYHIGLDIAKVADYTVLTAVNLHTFPFRVYPQVSFNQIDYPLQQAKIETFWEKYNQSPILMDDTGGGKVFIDSLSRTIHNIEGYTFTESSRSELLTNLAIKIEQQMITIPDDEQLIMQLKGFHWVMSATGKQRMISSLKHDDLVMSMALSLMHLPARPRTYKNDQVESEVKLFDANIYRRQSGRNRFRT